MVTVPSAGGAACHVFCVPKTLKFFIVLLQLASLHDLSLSAAPVSSLLVDVL